MYWKKPHTYTISEFLIVYTCTCVLENINFCLFSHFLIIFWSLGKFQREAYIKWTNNYTMAMNNEEQIPATKFTGNENKADKKIKIYVNVIITAMHKS